jgi:hypothetical protein
VEFEGVEELQTALPKLNIYGPPKERKRQAIPLVGGIAV